MKAILININRECNTYFRVSRLVLFSILIAAASGDISQQIVYCAPRSSSATRRRLSLDTSAGLPRLALPMIILSDFDNRVPLVNDAFARRQRIMRYAPGIPIIIICHRRIAGRLWKRWLLWHVVTASRHRPRGFSRAWAITSSMNQKSSAPCHSRSRPRNLACEKHYAMLSPIPSL